MCFFARPKVDLFSFAMKSNVATPAYAHYCVPVLPNSPTVKFPYGIEEIGILDFYENMRVLAER